MAGDRGQHQRPAIEIANLVAAGIDSVISISTFETFAQAEDANTVIRQIVKDTMSSLIPNPPKAIVGEVISYLGK